MSLFVAGSNRLVKLCTVESQSVPVLGEHKKFRLLFLQHRFPKDIALLLGQFHGLGLLPGFRSHFRHLRRALTGLERRSNGGNNCKPLRGINNNDCAVVNVELLAA